MSLVPGTGYALGIPLAWYLGVRRHWPTPLLGVWCGNAFAVSWAAAWTLCVVCCIRWKSIQPVAALSVQQHESSTSRERFLDG